MLIKLRSSEIELTLTPIGAAIYELKTKDKFGKFRNIVLTHNDINAYEGGNPSYLGATCGRIIGRIANGKFDVNGETFELTKNFNNMHTMHGGEKNLARIKWDYEIYEEGDRSICVFKYFSKHLEEGFPGNVDFTVEYILEYNSLSINYLATSDRPTYLSLTNHSYFNLSNNDDTVYEHNILVNSKEIVTTDADNITSGKEDVSGTDLDLRKLTTFGELDNKSHEALKKLGGFDCVYLLEEKRDFDVYLEDIQSGRNLKIKSTYPSLIVYTYNADKNFPLKERENRKHIAVALEPVYVPNAVNNKDFYIPLVDKDNPYKNSIKYTFNTVLEK